MALDQRVEGESWLAEAVAAYEAQPTGRERACKNPDCGRRFLPGIKMRERRQQEYCNTDCRMKAQIKRQVAKKQAARGPVRTIACDPCGKTFTTHRIDRISCSKECRKAHKKKHEKVKNAERRLSLNASKVFVPPRPAPKACEACGGKVRRDREFGGLVYCMARCGWAVVLTARERDPRAGTPDPVEDPEES